MTLLSLVNCEMLNRFLVIFRTCKTWFMNNGLKSASELIEDLPIWEMWSSWPLPTTSFSFVLSFEKVYSESQIRCDVISGSTIDIPILIIDGCWWRNECCMLVVLSMLIFLLRSFKWDVKPMIATNGNTTLSSTQLTGWSIRVSTGTLTTASTTVIIVWSSTKLVVVALIVEARFEIMVEVSSINWTSCEVTSSHWEVRLITTGSYS